MAIAEAARIRDDGVLQGNSQGVSQEGACEGWVGGGLGSRGVAFQVWPKVI